MFLDVRTSRLSGTAPMPGSKSHTIRGVILGTLAEGESLLRMPLDSLDTLAAAQACRALGAKIDASDPECWRITGVGGRPRTPDNVIDVANSGTTLYVVLATAALCPEGWVVLTGDKQIRRRPAQPLIDALWELGAEVISTRGNGCCPILVRGPLKGGEANVNAITSQYVTAVLLNAPLAEGDTHLCVANPNEIPYVRMTLDWLDKLGVAIEYDDGLTDFRIPGGQRYGAFDLPVAADFSSATFFLVGGAMLGGELELTGLDMNDPQGDKAVIDYLREMGADIRVDDASGAVRVKGGALRGADLDLNATPDALPAMAVAAAFAEGRTRLGNVAQARVKETDRIAVMAVELRKMGVEVDELEDGLVIQGTGGALKGATDLSGHDDHRIVMALSLAGMSADAPSRIDTAEAMAVTVPNYVALMHGLGADMETAGE